MTESGETATRTAGALTHFPARIAVIGGGRWARVITDVLCSVASPSARISVHSAHNAEAMSEWAAARGRSRQIAVSADWPQLDSPHSSAVVVVNAARDHERAAEEYLRRGAAVLIEKPMVASTAAARRLVALAEEGRASLAPAHVFLFARYAENFGRLVREAGGARSLTISWTDPRGEARYGEEKRYDAGVPVFADVMPHILSLMYSVAAALPDRAANLSVKRGGAEVAFDLSGGAPLARVEIARNSDKRRRIVETETSAGPMKLDFSQEPGWIMRGSERQDADPQWGRGPSPIAAMLSAFLSWAGGGARDPRLDTALALAACRLTDQISDQYRAINLPWLAERLAGASGFDEDFNYALCELLQRDGPLPPDVLGGAIARIRSELAGAMGEKRRRSLAAERDPAGVLREFVPR